MSHEATLEAQLPDVGSAWELEITWAQRNVWEAETIRFDAVERSNTRTDFVVCNCLKTDYHGINVPMRGSNSAIAVRDFSAIAARGLALQHMNFWVPASIRDTYHGSRLPRLLTF
jgi:hypothetical protein